MYELFFFFDTRVIPSVDSLKVASSLENLQANCSGKNMADLEHVQVEISLNFTLRGDLEVNLTSPLGTTSRLIQYRPRDNFNTLKNWKILTLHHWGENPTGVWKLTLKNSRPQRRNTGMFLFCYIIYINVYLNKSNLRHFPGSTSAKLNYYCQGFVKRTCTIL